MLNVLEVRQSKLIWLLYVLPQALLVAFHFPAETSIGAICAGGTTPSNGSMLNRNVFGMGFEKI